MQQERDELYRKFTAAILEVQQKVGFKNLVLERKMQALSAAVEKKEAQFNEVLAASNLDPAALTLVSRKLEVGPRLQHPIPVPQLASGAQAGVACWMRVCVWPLSLQWGLAVDVGEGPLWVSCAWAPTGPADICPQAPRLSLASCFTSPFSTSWPLLALGPRPSMLTIGLAQPGQHLKLLSIFGPCASQASVTSLETGPGHS